MSHRDILCAHLAARPREGAVRSGGFTLIELGVVTAIVVVMAAILIPVLVGVGEHNKRVICAGNLRKLGTAAAGYAVDNDRALPTHFARRTASFDTFAMLDEGGQGVNLGLLVAEVPRASTFYCPTQTEETSPGIACNGACNRWRFRVGLGDGDGGGGGSALSGRRSAGQGQGDGGDGEGGQGGGVNSSYPVRARFGQRPGLPRWTLLNYTNKVIYSDFIGVDGWTGPGAGPLAGPVRAPHGGRGYNRLFGDDSVQWVSAEAVDASRPVTATAPTEGQLQEYYLLLDVLP